MTPVFWGHSVVGWSQWGLWWLSREWCCQRRGACWIWFHHLGHWHKVRRERACGRSLGLCLRWWSLCSSICIRLPPAGFCWRRCPQFISWSCLWCHRNPSSTRDVCVGPCQRLSRSPKGLCQSGHLRQFHLQGLLLWGSVVLHRHASFGNPAKHQWWFCCNVGILWSPISQYVLVIRKYANIFTVM